MTSDHNKVICPDCNHEFVAVPVNIQERIAELTDELSLATVRAASRLTRIKELETALHLAEEKQE